MKITEFKIDWINHFVAFLSALLGIFIAFQLQDYQEHRQEKEKLQITINAIRKEIKNNMEIYSANIDDLSDWLDYYHLGKLVRENGEVGIPRSEFEKMKSKAPKRVDSWLTLDLGKDSILIHNDESMVIRLDVAPQNGISTSSWQAGLYSGILTRLDSKKLTLLTNIYEWINKDIGLNEREFYESLIIKSKFDDLKKIEDYYTRIVKIQQMKYNTVKRYLDEIEW